MLRLPQGHSCPELSGSIVIATSIKRVSADGTIWYIEPPLFGKNENRYTGALEVHLYPLDNPSDDEVDTHSIRVLETH